MNSADYKTWRSGADVTPEWMEEYEVGSHQRVDQSAMREMEHTDCEAYTEVLPYEGQTGVVVEWEYSEYQGAGFVYMTMDGTNERVKFFLDQIVGVTTLCGV